MVEEALEPEDRKVTDKQKFNLLVKQPLFIQFTQEDNLNFLFKTFNTKN